MRGCSERAVICKPEGRFLVPHQVPILLTPWSWISQPPELWEIDDCCLSNPVDGVLLQQPKLTNTLYISILKFPNGGITHQFSGYQHPFYCSKYTQGEGDLLVRISKATSIWKALTVFRVFSQT